MTKARFVLIVALALFAAAGLAAQIQTGRIVGTVTDPQAAVVPGAKVTAVDVQTGVSHATTANETGSFILSGLPFGTYTVFVEANGFRKWEGKNVQVITAQDSVVKAVLELGTVAETVTVEAGQQVIDTASAELNTSINRKQIIDLPLSTRNPMDLVRLQAGVTGGTTARTSVFNGLRGNTNNITQDGVNIQDNYIRSDGFFAQSAPTVENTGEFSISSQNVGSDSGAGVGQVRIATPRGSSQFRGSLFYFHRNDAMSANTWGNNLTGNEKEREREHRFGGHVGGPVFIPKLYDGRERSFFFFRYEGYRENFSSSVNRTVLTQQARQGLFRYVDSTGTTQTVNLITASTRGFPINSLIQQLVNTTPLPNNTLRGDGLNNGGFQFNVVGKDKDDRYTLRFDHRLLQSPTYGTHWLEVSANWGNFFISPDLGNANEAVFPEYVVTNGCVGGVCMGAGQFPKRRQLAAAIHSTLGSTMFNEFRFGLFRPFSSFEREQPFPRAFRVAFGTVSGQTAASTPEQNFLDQGRFTPNYTFIENFSKVRGAHNFKTGFQIVSLSTTPFNEAGIIPQVTLGSNTSNSDGLSTTSFPNLPAGSAGTTLFNRARAIYQNLVGLLGTVAQTFNAYPGQGFVPGASDFLFLRERAYNFYFSDQWRVRTNLTVNYGVRYELIKPPDAVNRRALQPVNSVEDLLPYGELFTPNSSITYQQILNGTVPAVQLDLAGRREGRPFWAEDRNNWAPFLGLAWSPWSKTVVRSGFAVSFTRDGLNVVSNAIGGNTGLNTIAQNSLPTGVLNPSADQSLPAPAFTLPVSQLSNYTVSGGSAGLFAFDPKLRTPYVLQWSFGIQQEVLPSTAVEIRYVGNHAVKLYRGIDLNQIDLINSGLLTEFQAARTNLACNRAAGVTSWANRGTACNVPMPLITQIQVPSTGSSSFYTSSTFITRLDNNEAGDWGYLIANNCALNYFRNAGTVCPGMAGLPANLFFSNPTALFGDVVGNSSGSVYHALQVEVRRSFSRGFMVQGNYTFGKALTDFSGTSAEFNAFVDMRQPEFERSRATFDIRHTFNMNAIWELPVGRGRRHLSSGILGKALEGWQLGGVWIWRSGRPLSILSNRATVNRAARSTGKVAAVPQGTLTGDQVCYDVGVYKTARGAFFLPDSYLTFPASGSGTLGANTAVLGNPGANSLGTKYLRLNCSGPGFAQVDMNLLKRTRITERINFEFRAEFFNILNHPNFLAGIDNATGTSVNVINNTNFGVLDGGYFPAREIQFNFRINF